MLSLEEGVKDGRSEETSASAYLFKNLLLALFMLFGVSDDSAFGVVLSPIRASAGMGVFLFSILFALNEVDWGKLGFGLIKIAFSFESISGLAFARTFFRTLVDTLPTFLSIAEKFGVRSTSRTLPEADEILLSNEGDVTTSFFVSITSRG